MKIQLAKSKAGHDKNHVFLLYKEDEEYVYLVNGTTKTVDRPKKKKRMHIQPIKKLPEEIKAYERFVTLDDHQVETILRIYQQRLLQGGNE